MKPLTFSFVIPLFNRPKEVEELLESMLLQSNTDFEVVIVEDGSSLKSDQVANSYTNKLDIKYFFKDNSGPGQTRNFGVERATGNYIIFLDSDCVLPSNYFEIVKSKLSSEYLDAFGGPDAAHDSFSDLQKAINYSMTSILTTGGIRGASEKADKFYPRSFNMGFSREVFNKTGGFAKMRFGEDIDMSIRILKNGFKTGLIKEAFVYHKRRSTLKNFYKQVYNSGIARINLFKKYPESLKLVHFAPALFTIGTVCLILISFFYPKALLLSGIYSLLVFIHASLLNKNIIIGSYSILTRFVQLVGYGLGFIVSFWKRVLLGKGEFASFEKTFYK